MPLEQQLLESCLTSCLELLAAVCRWYGNDREREKASVLNALSAILTDFADYPFYSPIDPSNSSIPKSLCKAKFTVMS